MHKKINILFVQFKKRFIIALPAILLFVFLFFTVIKLFGVEYSLIVIFITITFQIRYRQRFTFKTAIGIFVIQSVLCMLAFFATVNIFLCIILNFIVPFILVYTKTNQFNQRGYFEHVMCFIYLQLRPVSFSELPNLFAALLYSVFIMVVALALHSILSKKSYNYDAEREGLSVLSEELSLLSERKKDDNMQDSIFKLQSSLYKLAFGNGGIFYVVGIREKIHFMFALLFQRTTYFVYDMIEQSYVMTDKNIEFLKKLSLYVKEASIKLNVKNNDELIEEANNFLNEIDSSNERFSLFSENFLHLFTLILKTMVKSIENDKVYSKIGFGNIKYMKDYIQYRIRIDSFQLRFAFRLSVVIMLSFIFCRIMNADHSYWLPMNAFLMMQPLYEDSRRKMKIRFAGTVLGSVIAFLSIPYLHGINAHFVFAVFIISFMYSSTRGTLMQVMCATILSLTLASLSMNDNTAIELRLVYLLFAIFLVLIADSFFLPVNKNTQFRFNIKGLFRIQSTYMIVLEESKLHSINYAYLNELFTDFYMLYDNIIRYITDNNGKDFSYYRKIIFTMWKIMSESEQIYFVMQQQDINEKERNIVALFASNMQILLEEIENNIFSENKRKQNISIDNFNVEDSYLNYLIQQYKENVSYLLSLILSS